MSRMVPSADRKPYSQKALTFALSRYFNFVSNGVVSSRPSDRRGRFDSLGDTTCSANRAKLNFNFDVSISIPLHSFITFCTSATVSAPR